MRVLLVATLVAMAAAGPLKGSKMNLKGKDSVIQMHKSFLKVYNQDDLIPVFRGIVDPTEFEAGKPGKAGKFRFVPQTELAMRGSYGIAKGP